MFSEPALFRRQRVEVINELLVTLGSFLIQQIADAKQSRPIRSIITENPKTGLRQRLTDSGGTGKSIEHTLDSSKPNQLQYARDQL
jgi:hypothetical protein